MLISEDTIREAAFELLASSTARRYMREAQRLAVSSGLVDSLRKDPASRSTAVARVTELLRQLQEERERSATEFETALLLCALARLDGSSPAIHQAIGVSSAWIRSLALRLVALGPANSEQINGLNTQIISVPRGQVNVSIPLRTSDRQNRALFPRAN